MESQNIESHILFLVMCLGNFDETVTVLVRISFQCNRSKCGVIILLKMKIDIDLLLAVL